MTTYVYETIPSTTSEEPKFFEIRQSMNDAPLDKHPETGEAIRRVILGGYGLMKKDAPASSAASDSCGPSCCCC